MDVAFGRVFVLEDGALKYLFGYSDEYAIDLGPGGTVEYEGRVYAFHCRHTKLEKTVLGTVLPVREEITVIPIADMKET